MGVLKHGMAGTREYRRWRGMIARCEWSKHSSFARYGGRGIAVCDRWRRSFVAFIEDMGACPAGHSLDRLNNDGPYAPENCRWATRKTQRQNSSTARFFIEWHGSRTAAIDVAKEHGVGPGTFYDRLNHGWTPFEASTTRPLRHWCERKAAGQTQEDDQ